MPPPKCARSTIKVRLITNSVNAAIVLSAQSLKIYAVGRLNSFYDLTAKYTLGNKSS